MSDAFDKLLQRSVQARRDRRLEDAERDLVEAVAISRTSGVRVELARALTALSQIERDRHCTEDAFCHYEEAAGLYRAEGDTLRLARTVRHAGDIQREAGHPELAEPCYHGALSLYRGHAGTPPLDLANAIRGLAILKSDAGETTAAKALWEEARALYAAVNVEAGVVESSRRLALLARKS
ncbi:MAG: hypothetical protein ACLQFM_15195 [Terriglobales bacterium]